MPAATATPPSSRPHAFGRSSNVWQYLELVHERRTPSSEGQPLSAFSISSDDFDSESNDSFAFVEPRGGRNEDDGNGEDDEIERTARGRACSKDGSDGTTAPIGLAVGRTPRKGSSGLSKSGVSLPELPTIGRVREPLAGRKPLGVAGRRAPSGFNSAEVMRRLNALGTSASVPLLAAPPLGGSARATESPPTSTGATSTCQGVGAASLGSTSTPGAPTPLTLPPPATNGAASVAPPLSDAEKLRNDFNSQATRLSYGCSVALELFNGHLMMVGSPDGQVRVQSLEKLQIPQIKGYKDRAIFTLLDLTDVRSAGSLRYGDSVWLQLSVGPGDVSWEQGGVLGAKVREAPQLQALGLMDDDAIRSGAPAPAVVGYPAPVTAYLPKSRDDGDLQVDEIQSRVRNKGAKMLGKWIIRSAVCQPRRKLKDAFVYNNDEVYLEQDWFYLGADSDAGLAVLRQLPPAAGLKDAKPGEYVVERRAAWKLRLLDSSSGSAGLSLAQQQMERLLLRAKTQLKQSQRMRTGKTKSYGPDLQGGSSFTAQLRAQMAASTRQTESRYADRQERRLQRIDHHLVNKANSMSVDLMQQSSDSTARSGGTSGEAGTIQRPPRPKTRGSSRRTPPATNRSGVASRERSQTTTPDDSAGSGGTEEDRAGEAIAGEEVSGGTAETPGSADSPPATESSCGLCHSSSIGVNLCCQFRYVMHLLQREQLLSTRQDVGDGSNIQCSTTATKKTARSRTGRTARSDDSASASGSGEQRRLSGSSNEATHSIGTESSATALATQNSVESSVSPSAVSSAANMTLCGPVASVTPSGVSSRHVHAPNARLLRLFATQDEAMLGLIKYKEKEAYRALAAEAHARAGLSPAAVHFRDRFKHVGLFMQKQQQQQQQQHGIGGHFQKLHADLFTRSSRALLGKHQRRKKQQRKSRALSADLDEDEDDDYYDDYYDSDSDDDSEEEIDADIPGLRLDMRTCPLEYPGEGFDVFGQPLEESDADSATPERLFPTTRELEKLPPVDTTAALALYVQNRAAMAEMLDGYAELVETQVVPALRAALGARNRGALVETLDFAARASEFVCARRVQVFVAQLLHAVAASEVGDFARFQGEFDALLVELQGAVNFIRFFRQQRTTRRAKK